MKIMKNSNRRILALLLSLLLIAAFTACDPLDKGMEYGPDSVSGTDKPESEAEYWVLSGIDMGTGMMEAEEAANFFESKSDEILSLKLEEDGAAGVILFGDYAAGIWKETEKGLDVTIDNGEEPMNIVFVRDDDDNLLYTDESGDLEMTMKLSEVTEVPAAFANNALANLDVNFSSEETVAMSNFMLGGEFACKDGMIYCCGFNKDGNPITMSFAFDPSREAGECSSDVKYLDEDCKPSYINLKDGYIYYKATDADGNSKICKMKEDGSEKAVLYDKNADYLQVDGDKLYFTDENYRLVSTDLSGGSLTTVIDKEVYYSYHLGGDWYVFQDDADGESLHLANTAMDYDEKISEGKVYTCVADGSYLYFVEITDGEKEVGNLARINLKTLKTERSECEVYSPLCINSTLIQGFSRDYKVEKDKWDTLENAGEESSNLGYLTKYFSDDTQIYWYTEKGNVVSQLAIKTADDEYRFLPACM